MCIYAQNFDTLQHKPEPSRKFIYNFFIIRNFRIRADFVWHFGDLNIAQKMLKIGPIHCEQRLVSKVDISHVIMVMDRFFFPFSCLLCLTILFCFLFQRGRVWLRGLDIVGQNKASRSLVYSFFLLLSKFEMYYGLSRVLLWGLTRVGLWFIDPVSGRFCVSRCLSERK